MREALAPHDLVLALGTNAFRLYLLEDPGPPVNPGTHVAGLARARGGVGAWPAFGGVDIAGIARCIGCPSVRVQTHDELVRTLDEVLPKLATRQEPLVLEVALEG